MKHQFNLIDVGSGVCLCVRVCKLFFLYALFCNTSPQLLQHCCMMLRHALNGQAKRTQHFQRSMFMFNEPQTLARNKWT